MSKEELIAELAKRDKGETTLHMHLLQKKTNKQTNKNKNCLSLIPGKFAFHIA